jgi:hypothetical protein
MLTVASVILADFVALKEQFIGPHHDAICAAHYANDTDDIPPLLLRAGQCRTFLQTRSYWHENYTPGITYYRPLSLTFFWIQYHLFGTTYFNRWVMVSVALHLCFCVIFGVFVASITRSRLAALCTVMLFAGFRSFPYTSHILDIFNLSDLAPALGAVGSWKDQPTLISDGLTILSLFFARKKKIPPSLICALIGVLFKESALITYPLILLMLLAQGELHCLSKRHLAIAAVCIAIPPLARYAAGMGLFVPHIQTNFPVMIDRYVHTISGVYFMGFLVGQWAATLFASGFYILAIRRHGTLLTRLAWAIGLVLVGGLIEGRLIGGSLAVDIVALFDPSMQLVYIVECLYWCAAFDAVIRFPNLAKSALLMAGMSLLAALPDIAVHSPPNTHRLHLCFAFQSAVLGIGAAAILRIVQQAAARHPNSGFALKNLPLNPPRCGT